MTDYKETLNLPKTDFSMKANLPSREPEFIKFWQKIDVYGLIRTARKGQKKFILHDGPPYANGRIHMGHALNKILKDIVVKYMTMRGFDSPYIPGWDCHGLPVEHQLFKELNIGKADIGQVEFRRKARDYAMKYVDIQKEEFRRLGVFGDWDNPYLTLSKEYESGVLKAFAGLVKEGYIYRDLKPVNWCAACETALAEAEVEYNDHTSPSVYVKFKIKSGSRVQGQGALRHSLCSGTGQARDTYFIIWTTTPWTLLANVAIAVHPDLKYAVVETENENWIILDSLVETTLKKTGKNYKILSCISGREFEGVIARHPFLDRDSRVVLADYVSSTEGTGCVHTAPGHGQEDYLTGKKYNLEMIMPVDARGAFDRTCGEFSGMNVFKANAKIMDRMKSDKTLIAGENITHSYPHCWRCKKPIVSRATEQWFMKIDHLRLRKKLLEAIDGKIAWYPEVGRERISSMVALRPDWCLSRQRYWGVPIPAFYCASCGCKILDSCIIMRIADMVKEEGVDAWFKKDEADLLPKNFACPKCGKNSIKKENDILDVWFESGVSHQVVLKNRAFVNYPCELYLEGSDQHRGWFQSALITAMAIDKIPPYKAVLTHGFTVDGEGKKMSKSLGNVTAPQDIMTKYGADILRLWVASSNYSDDVRISDEIVRQTADAYRKIRNTFRYLLSNLYDFDPEKDMKAPRELLQIDRWMLSRLGRLVTDITRHYDNFLFHKLYRDIYNFCTIEVSSLYLDVLKDRMYTFKNDSPARRSGQTVIFKILDSLVRMLAPVLSFTTEEVWATGGFRRTGHEAVHLGGWPDINEAKNWIDESLDKIWEDLISAREGVLKALEEKRAKGLIGSSLEAKVKIEAKKSELRSLLEKEAGELASLFIVSEVEIGALGAGESFDFPQRHLKIEVVRARGRKCSRCWTYSVSVGEDAGHPEICKKCLDNIY